MQTVFLITLATTMGGVLGQISLTLPPNPPGPDANVQAKCLYHTQTSVNYCAGGNVPNCARVDFEALGTSFSYEGCDCNKTIERGVDLILVFDQLPHLNTQATITESQETWLRLTTVGATTLNRTVGFADNRIGFIRPTMQGCDLFGLTNSTFMLPGDQFVNSLNLFGWKNFGPCVTQPGNPPCAPKQTRHLDCVEFARNTLVAGDLLRRKVIFSLRHSPDSGTFVMKNEPANNLIYFVATAVQQGLTGNIDFTAPDSVQSQFDFGNFERVNGQFILGKASDRALAFTLNQQFDPDLGIGYVRCNNTNLQRAFLPRDFNAEAPSQVSDMICTIFPSAPSLAWWTLDAFSVGDQSFVRGTVSAFTSWLCELNTLTDSPTATPSSNPTSSPSVGPTSNPTSNPTRNPTKNPTRNPTSSPTDNPTNKPSANPSKNPTRNPSKNPTQSPTTNPTANPTKNPSANPSANPTQNPTKNPTANPTKNPTANPTSNPTLSPTTCLSRDIPSFTRSTCTNPATCTGPNAVVTQGGPPTITVNSGQGTTTFCYQFSLPNNGGGSCSSAGLPVTSISFVTDECCPVPSMEFLSSVAVPNVVEYNRISCTQGDVSQAFNSQCTRTSRTCEADNTKSCGVLNVNSLDIRSPTFGYCLTVSGTNLVAPGGGVDPASSGKAKICFERDTGNAQTQNVCSCLEVPFVRSEAICRVTPRPTKSPSRNPTKNPTNNPTANPTANPTKNPSANPTKNPTQNPTGSPTPNPTANPTKNPTISPTTCQQREVPNFQRRNCLDENGCTGSAAAVTVSNNGNPVSVNANTAAGTTTVCYTLNIPTSLASPCSDAQFRALRGVSFVVDECCPAPSMEFLESVRVGESVSTNREQCVQGNVSGAFDSLCTRTRRPCVANSNEMCSVLNVNGLNEPAGTSVQYCITVQGTNFDLNPPPNEIDADVRGTAKMCFERGVENPRGPLNVCTCVQVGFIDSQRLCNSTAAPSAGPTQTPTANPTKNPTSNPTNNPTRNPTANPTQDPTSDPSPTPTSGPTANPTKIPTSNPTQDPTADPTRNPTRNPTKNPTKNPTSNPTLSPTPCRQLPPPDFRRKDCNAANPCDGSSAVVTVGNNGDPSVVTKNGDGTTTVCYDLSLVVSPDPNCNVGNQAMTGVSFILDECCPTPMMQYFDVVSISGGGSGSTSVSVNREACTQGDLSQTMGTQCTRTSRMCATNPSQKCTVLNLNNLDVKPGRTVQYCIKVQGENFAAVSPPNTLDPSVKGIAKFCFESGSTSPSGPTNVCTCTQVGFIESPRLCNATGSPTQNPTPNPTATPTKNPTNSPSASPTRNPSPNPTSSPTRNPTTCLSRDIPDFTGKDCTDTTTCSGLNAIVKVTGSTVVANQGSGTTKLCYQMALNNGVGSCAVGNVPVRGISFVTDECCPAPNMEFLDTVSVTSSTGSTQYNRVECVKGVVANAFDNNCARTTRSCVSKPLSNCSVLNVNNLNVSGPNFEYCVEIAGTNYDVVTPGTIDPSAAGQAKICFERGESVPPGSNICSCVEVVFPRSTRICQVTPLPTKSPTKNPTKNPTANPTLSPTTCKQSEVPSFPRKDCSEANGCSGSSAIVTVGNGGEPTATSDGNGTTTVCYDLNLVANPDGSCSSAGNQPMTGVSFIIDECCPTPMMEYFETVSISGGGAGSAAVSVNREECTEGSAVQTMNAQCARTRRTCRSDSTQQCTVLNLNNLAVNPGATAKYCIKVQGEFDVKVPIGQLDPDVKGKAKFCFERGSTNPSGPINVCTCVEVGFIESPRLCQATFPPTPFPTPTPDCLIPPVFPRPRPCNFSCNFSSSNWNVSLVDRVVSSDVNGDISTTFTYSASSLRKYSTRKSDSSNGGTARGRGGWASSTDSKPNRRLGWSTTAKPSKKVSLRLSSESKDGRSSSKKVSSKKVSAGSGSAASKKTSKSNDKPSKKTSSKKTSKGQQSGSKKIQSKKVLKKVSKKISKKQKTPPCEAYLNKWVLRLDECCGVGVLKDAVASGLVKVSVNGKACKRTRKCKIRSNGQNGDVIVVYGMKSTLSITMQGDVKLTRGGSVCAQGSEACACKPMMTPNTCLLPTRSPTVKPTMNPLPPPTRKTARPTKVWKRMSKDASKGSKKQDGKNKGDKAGKKLKQSGGNGGSGKKRKSSSGKKDTDRMKPTTKKHY